MLDANTADGLERVHAFWDTEPCGTHFVGDFVDERDFFAEYRKFRYRTEWHIPGFASFPEARGKRVLEIGCGNGADGVMFARHGAHYTGIDLTAEAVDATRRHFAVEGLDGRFHQENTEQLRFANDSFDVVYSFGVLHHTPTPEQAVHEVYRVLKPGGVALVMLYHRHSFNYYVRILGYMRARVLFAILSRGRPRDVSRNPTGARQIVGLRGNTSRRIWDVHYDNFRAEGWRYLKASSFVHHCTDGPECPYAYTYSARDAKQLFASFGSVETSVAHFPLNKYWRGRTGAGVIEKLLAKTCGWHLLIRATK